MVLEPNKVCHCFHCFPFYLWARVKEKKNTRRKKWLALPYHSGFSFRVESVALFVLPQHPQYNWRRKWQPTPVFLSGNSHGQRSLVGYSPWGHKELDMNEHARMHTHPHAHTHITILHCSVTTPSLELFTMNTFPHLSCTLFSFLTRQ